MVVLRIEGDLGGAFEDVGEEDARALLGLLAPLAVAPGQSEKRLLGLWEVDEGFEEPGAWCCE